MAHCDFQGKSHGLTRRGMMQSVAGVLAVNEFLPLASAAGNVGNMKITELKTFVVGNP
jgi:hypothetical protein